MTAKRFTNHDDTIIDTDGEQLISTDEIVDKMNELHEENQDLKAFNQDLSEELSVCANKRLAQGEHLTELKQENEQLRHDATILIQSNQDYRKENEKLKAFIQELTTKGTGRIDLANGYSYSVSAVLTNWKGDV